MGGAEITNVKKVIQAVGDEYANKVLAKGWILLDTYRFGVPSDSDESQMVGYVLGWTGEVEPPR